MCLLENITDSLIVVTKTPDHNFCLYRIFTDSYDSDKNASQNTSTKEQEPMIQTIKIKDQRNKIYHQDNQVGLI
ncbi:uncharacterized protein DS421_2g43470 [Arachis hypogaea]|nr:uncharacterized protein DS421_2g43470 [Arachis hypogaea]